MNTQASPSPPWSPPLPPAKKVATPAKEPPKKKEKEKKTKEAPIKPWDMSIEECDRITQERVKEHFKPKPKPKLEPEKVINPIDLKFFKGMCEANKRKFIPRDPLQTTNAQLSKLLRKRRDNQSRHRPTFHSSEPKKTINRASRSGTDDATTRLCYIFERIKPDGGSDCRGEDIPKADVVVKWTYELFFLGKNGRMSWANLLYPPK